MLRKAIALVLIGLPLSACATGQVLPTPPAALERDTGTTDRLESLPAPTRPLDVAVYSFPDLTGQAKPNASFAEYSRAVTQGGASILVDVLKTVGQGTWFRPVERAGLNNLVQERTLIENTQKAYGGGNQLPPVRFAGVILEGGIVGYDADEITGGAGAKFLGIGGDVQYRSDVVTVNLRAVSVQTGEVLASTTTTKQIFSFLGRGGAYKFVSGNDLLEIEAGRSRNDPVQLAVREGIELAVYSLVVEGLKQGLWDLSDPAREPVLIQDYLDVYKVPESASALPI